MSIPELNELSKDGREGREFRVQNRRIFLTYKSHLNKEMVKNWFKGEFAVKRVEVCHETGDEQCPYPHSHVYVDFGKNFSTQNCRRFDLPCGSVDTVEQPTMIHPNIQIVKTAKHEENVLRYMGKEDPECKDLVQDEPNIVEMIWAAQTKTDALRCAKKFSDVQGIMQLYTNKPQDYAEPPPLPLLWQRDAEEFLVNSPPDRRAIWWYFDRIGSTGKSELVATMIRKYPRDVYFMNDFNKLSDAMCVIKNAIDGGWSGKILLVDLARSFEARASIFAALENVKNGLITSTKYSGGSVFLDATPHIMCFANFMPTFCAMSADRWNVAELIQERNPDGTRLGEPRVELRNRSECENIQANLDWLKFVSDRDKELATKNWHTQWCDLRGVKNSFGPLPTSPVNSYSVNYCPQ